MGGTVFGAPHERVTASPKRPATGPVRKKVTNLLGIALGVGIRRAQSNKGQRIKPKETRSNTNKKGRYETYPLEPLPLWEGEQLPSDCHIYQRRTKQAP